LQFSGNSFPQFGVDVRVQRHDDAPPSATIFSFDGTTGLLSRRLTKDLADRLLVTPRVMLERRDGLLY
jgi:hypothetical protein